MKSFLFSVLLLACLYMPAQNRPYWEMMQDSAVDLDATRAAFEQYWQGRTPEKGQGYKAFRRWEYQMMQSRLSDGTVPAQGYEAAELERWRLERSTEKRTNAFPTGNWRPLGPVLNPVNNTGQPGGIGRTTTVAFHPTQTSWLYAGSPNGGLWLSTDNGVSWAMKTDFLATLGVSAILVDPVTPTTIYIGTGDKDGGDASGLGVYKSIDGGNTWAAANTGMGNRTVHSLAFDPSSSATIIAATSNGIYRTTNSAGNWTQTLASGTTYETRYKAGSNSNVYAINATRFYTSTDDGATWNTGTVIATSARSAFALTTADANLIFVIKDVGANPVFKSTDGGASFTNVQTDAKVLLNGSCSGTGTGGQGWYDICIAIDPSNSNNITVGGVSLWKSTDGGVNFNIMACWSSMATDVHADHHFLMYSPHVAGRLFDCNDGGMYYTDNFGTSFTNISSGLAVSQIYRTAVSASNPEIHIGGFQDNGMIIARNTDWWITVGGDGLDCAIDPSDNNYQYGSYVNGVIRRSTNAGLNWSTIGNNGVGGITESGAWLTPYILRPGSPQEMLAGYVSVWRCTDTKVASPTWTNVYTFATGTCTDFGFGDANTVYMSRDDGSFHRSLDGGLTWAARTNTPGGEARDIAVDPITPVNVWVAAGNDVYKSTDGGGTWTIWDTGLPNLAARTLVYDRVSQALYVGMNIGVYYRGIADASWSAFSTNLPNTRAQHLVIYYDAAGCVGRDVLRLATYGRGIWESDLRAGTTLAPVACFGADTTQVCRTLGVLQLRDSSGYDPTSWLWTITGPGSVAYVNATTNASQNPQVTFGADGLYTVQLQVSNANGSDSKSRVNYIHVVTPLVNFTSPDTLIYLSQSTRFTDASADCVSSWLWNFGDGNTSTLENPTHTYATAGLYTVTLTVNGGVNATTKTGYIQVLPHLPVPYTQVTAGWTGDMETSAWHFGDKRMSGTLNTWERGSVTLTFPAAASGTNCWATDLDANLPVASYSTAVYSPTFDLSAAGKYQIRLKTAMTNVFCNAPIGARVEYTTDLGTTWTRLGGKQGTDANAQYNWYTHGATGSCDNIDVIADRIGWNYNGSTAFRQAIYDASALAGNSRVGFRVAFFSSGSYGAFTTKGFAFDDFEIDYVPVPAPTDTIPGRMIAFDGTNDYVETFYPAAPANFTVECWVMAPAAPATATRTAICQKSSVFEMNWNHTTAANRGAVIVRNNASTNFVATFGALTGNTWYHLAATFDGTNIRTYKDGVLITTTAFTGTLNSNTNTWILGMASTGYFGGSVDEFRIWNVARTQQQIREAMHRTLDAAEVTNVVLYYQSNETTGYLKDPVNLRNGYLQNGLGRSLSPIAVGKGYAESQTITGTGVYNFNTVGLDLNFTAAAGTPFDMTVTRIRQFVNEQTPNPAWNAAPNTALVDPTEQFYQVVNKYGGGAFSVNATVRYVPDISVSEAASPAVLKWVKRGSNSVGVWDAGIPAAAATSGAGFTGTATFNGVTTFSQAFIASEQTDLLPIEGLYLTALADPYRKAIQAGWYMESEAGILYYELERMDGETGRVQLLDTRQAGEGTYHYEDAQVLENVRYYYRVRAWDAAGQAQVSDWAEAMLTRDAGVSVRPIPADQVLMIDLVAAAQEPVVLELTDAAGRVVKQEAQTAEPGIFHRAWDVSGLAQGVYLLRWRSGTETGLTRIMIRH